MLFCKYHVTQSCPVHLIQCISAAGKQISRDQDGFYITVLVSLRETICFHLRRELYCCTQHFFNSVQSEDYHSESSPQIQIQSAARDFSEQRAVARNNYW